ncbi:MAG: type II toxin-antitoxin system VapC family toxin [Bacteroidetes bacterium]|nr:type II toxin-antitoxin system VapC family toxin [Bacteroidota bacterium]MCH8525366.1 type II toxin-antitoxin system VapC family toxin [Balneolales bacterium]
MFLLDTDICIYLIKRTYPELNQRVYRAEAGSLMLSAVTLAELEYGAAMSQRPAENRETMTLFASAFEIVGFDAGDARYFGLIRAALRKAGKPIGPYDLQIAAQCLARGMTLVTHNAREFLRVPELRVEDWVKE